MEYSISSEKLQAVTEIFNADNGVTETPELVENNICADWNEGAEHQDWIDTASEQEIADWLASFYN